MNQKAYKLQTRSPSALISKLRELNSNSRLSSGHGEAKPYGQGVWNQEEGPISQHLVNEFHNIE